MSSLLIFLSILVLFPLILFPVFGESRPVYTEPYSPIFTDKSIYSWTDKIKIKIISPSWNTNKHLIDSIGNTKDHSINIATSEHSLKSYKFTETDVNSGIFTGEVILTGFIHDVDGDGNADTTPRTFGNGPTGGFLETDRDSVITISFEFADGVVLVESVPVSWNVGTIDFLKDVFFSDTFVMIRVVDVDMNLNSEILDSVSIHLFSDSDIAGINVNAVETSESSGSFVAKIFLSQNSSSGNRLYALPGDDIFGKYDDYTLPKPFSQSDNLAIETFAKIDSSIPPTDRLKILPTTFSDNFGNPLDIFSSNTQTQMIGTVVNDHDFKQKFVYLFQVKNPDNSVESISWIQGELLTKQSLDVSQSWIPKKSGVYTVETFVWNSINDPIALSPSLSTLITVE